MTKTIGLDTSSTSTGYSIFVDGKYESCGCINKKKIKDVDLRQEEMCKDIISLLDTERPDIVYWEIPFLGKNPETQKILGMITGVVYGWCISHGTSYDSFKPSSWRKLVQRKNEKLPRKREYLKQWSIGLVKETLDIDVNDDTADAILIAKAGVIKYS